MLSKNEMHTTFMELAPHFLTFLEGEKNKIEAEVARLKATEDAETKSPTADGNTENSPPETPIPATAVAASGPPTEATDETAVAEPAAAETNKEPQTNKARRVGGLRRRT